MKDGDLTRVKLQAYRGVTEVQNSIWSTMDIKFLIRVYEKMLGYMYV